MIHSRLFVEHKRYQESFNINFDEANEVRKRKRAAEIFTYRNSSAPRHVRRPYSDR